MNPEVEALQAKLRQVDDYAAKGLLRADEAQAQRDLLLKRMMHLVVPDTPAPRLPWRVRLWGLAAMLVLVGACSAYLVSGHAGLRRRSEAFLDQGRIVAAQDVQARRERLERIRRGESLAPDQYGRFAPASSASAATAGSPASATASTRPASGANNDAIAPLLSGRIVLDPKLEAQVDTEDALFVTVRVPGDPTGLPLAQIRVGGGNLPFDFDIGTRELIGTPERFMQAREVVVTARVSRSGHGQPEPGDLVGTSAVVAPWAGDVRVRIDQVVPKR